jgi:hypothetical protein
MSAPMKTPRLVIALLLSLSAAAGASPRRAELGGYWQLAGPGRAVALELREDGSFTSYERVECIRAPCPPVRHSGRWSMQAANGTAMGGRLRLDFAKRAEVYGFSRLGDTLLLRRKGQKLRYRRAQPPAAPSSLPDR